jgi:hypothetical protein
MCIKGKLGNNNYDHKKEIMNNYNNIKEINLV